MVALASAQDMPPPGHRPSPGAMPMPMPMPMPGLAVPVLAALQCDRLPPELQLTDAQREKLQAIAEGLHADQMQQRAADDALAQRWSGLLAAQTVDAQAAEALRAQTEQAHDAMSRRLLKATLEAAAVLTPAQRAQLAVQAKAHGEPGHPEGEGSMPAMPGMPPPPRFVQ